MPILLWIRMHSRQLEQFAELAITAVFCAFCSMLFFGELSFFFGGSSQAGAHYPSDLPSHITSALYTPNDTYSILFPLYHILWYRVPGGLLIVTFLTLLLFAIVQANKFFASRVVPGLSSFAAYLFGLFSILTFALPWRILQGNFTAAVYDQFAGNSFHNGTVLLCKFFVPLIMLVFFKLYEQRGKPLRLSVGWLVLFCVLQTLAILAKPSFFVAFAPALLILFFVELTVLIKGKGSWEPGQFKRELTNMLVIGAAAAVPLLILVYQMQNLFGSGDEHVVFGLFTYLRWGNSLPVIVVKFLCAFPFILMILVANWRAILKRRSTLIVYLTWFIALCEFCFLSESGGRFTHGNMGWGLETITPLVLILCAGTLVSKMKELQTEYRLRKQQTLQRSFFWRCAYYGVAAIVLTIQVIFGIRYFILIAAGAPFI